MLVKCSRRGIRATFARTSYHTAPIPHIPISDAHEVREYSPELLRTLCAVSYVINLPINDRPPWSMGEYDGLYYILHDWE